MAGKVKLESLEAFRGIAAVLVVLFHSQIYSSITHNTFIGNSFLFVDFFFVLSGFVMIYVYDDRLNKLSEIIPYIVLRFGRIYPLHLAILLAWLGYILAKYIVYAKTGLGHDPTDVNNLESFILNLLLLHSMGFLTEPSWNDPSWSISVEFYTYIVFAAFCLMPSVKKFRPYLAPLIALLSYYYLLKTTTRSDLNIVYDLGIFRCIGGFFSGITVYYLFKSGKFCIKRGNTIFEALAIAFLIFAATNASQNLTLQMVTLFSFTIVVLVFSVQHTGYISQLLHLKPFQIIGKYSYSIYMLHALILDLCSNVFEYIFKYKFTPIDGNDYIVIGEFPGLMVNIGMILLVIYTSSFTYKYIENRYRLKFRDISRKL